MNNLVTKFTLDGVEPVFRDRVQQYFELMLSELFLDIKEYIVEIIIPDINIVEYVRLYMKERNNEIYLSPSYGELAGKTFISDDGTTIIFSSLLFKYGFYDEEFKKLVLSNVENINKNINTMDFDNNFILQLSIVYHEFTHVRNHYEMKKIVTEVRKDKLKDKYILNLATSFYDEYLAVYKTSLAYFNQSNISFYEELERIVSEEYNDFKIERKESIDNSNWGNLMNISIKYIDEVLRYLASIYGFIVSIKEKYINFEEDNAIIDDLILKIEQFEFGDYFKMIFNEITSNNGMEEKINNIYIAISKMFEFINVHWTELEDGNYYVGVK